MIAKKKVFCSIKNDSVEALIEEKPAKKNTPPTYNILSCTGIANCSKTAFCKFVNPLTTANPIDMGSLEGEAAAAK